MRRFGQFSDAAVVGKVVVDAPDEVHRVDVVVDVDVGVETEADGRQTPDDFEQQLPALGGQLLPGDPGCPVQLELVDGLPPHAQGLLLQDALNMIQHFSFSFAMGLHQR